MNTYEVQPTAFGGGCVAVRKDENGYVTTVRCRTIFEAQQQIAQWKRYVG